MNVLIACEESQQICIAFRKLGHISFSCDLIPCSGLHPEWHILQDVSPLLNGSCTFFTCDGELHFIKKWDLIIAHPPCTYLSKAGARWLYQNHKLNYDRFLKGIAAKEFFLKILSADCDKIAIENPIPLKIFDLPLCSQIIQPYQFGDPWSKATCLWLKGLPILLPNSIILDYKPYCTSSKYSKTKDKKYIGASRIGGAAKTRSKTFPGIAAAMAAQWSIL